MIHSILKMNKYNFIVRFLLLLLILLSIGIFVYWTFAKVNISDIFYHRIETFDNDEKVELYRYEIESAIELLKACINMVLLC